jgi:hypothetical protein
LTEVRKKLLFDIVGNKIGWSAKAVQCNIKLGNEFELVIQRADVFKKRIELGFPSLTILSDVQEIGTAVLKHWQEKIIADSISQKITDKRVCILLKEVGHKRFAYFEEDIKIYQPDELVWKWTDATKTGLQGIQKTGNFCVYRWYPNQKQLFERFKLPLDTFIFTLEPQRIPLQELIDWLNQKLRATP